jgi:hypothetical protein
MSLPLAIRRGSFVRFERGGMKRRALSDAGITVIALGMSLSCGARSGLEQTESGPASGGRATTAIGTSAAGGSASAISEQGGAAGSVVSGPRPATCIPGARLSHRADRAVIGDWNRDGKLDVATIDLDAPHVSVLIGRGDGTFDAEVEYDSATPCAIDTGDFDGDRRPDLLTISCASGIVSVFRGGGDGTFASSVDYYLPTTLFQVTVGDWNHDGLTDAAIKASEHLYILSSLREGAFGLRGNCPAAGTAITAGGLNQDGDLDLVVSGNVAQVFLGNPFSSFSPGATFTAHDGIHGVVLADLNSDSKLDMATNAPCPPDGGARSAVLLGNGDGTFQAPIDLARGCDDVPVVGDLNGDGNLDLLQGGVLLGKGDGTFVPGRDLWQTWGNLLGDFTGDGILDLLTLVRGDGYYSSIHVSTGYGDGTFFPSSCSAR